MRIDSAFPSNYLKAADLQGKEAKVIMKGVQMEDIGSDHKPVLYFQGKEKGLVLNKTNSTNISAAYGPETEDWNGKPIVLYTAWVDFQGRSVEAIRCRPARAADLAQSSPQAPVSPPPRSVREMEPPAAPQSAYRPGDMDDEIPFAPEWRG